MNSNWDLFIILPLMIILPLGIFSFFYYQKLKINYYVTNKKIVLSLISSFLFFTICALLVSRPSPNLNDNTEIVEYFLFATPLVYALIFSYPLNVLSKKIKSRKLIIWTAFISAILGAAFNFFDSPDNYNFPILILTSICFGYTLAAIPMFFLSHNEHPYLKVEPFKALEVTAPIVAIGLITGFWLSSLFNDFITINNAHLTNVVISVFIISLSIPGLIFSLYFVEKKMVINTWSDNVIPSILRPTKPKNVMNLLLISSLIILVISITQSYTSEQLINYSDQIKRFNYIMFLVGLLIAAFSTSLILKFKISLKHLINFGLIILSLYFVIISFSTNPWLLSVFSAFKGFASGLLILLFIVFAMNWEYRTKKITIMGFIMSCWFFVNILSNLFTHFLFNNLGTDLFANGVSTLFYSVSASLFLLLIILNFFTSSFFLGEYFDLFLYLQTTKYKLRQVNAEELNISMTNVGDSVLSEGINFLNYRAYRKKNKKHKKATGQNIKKSNVQHLIKKQKSAIKKSVNNQEKTAKLSKKALMEKSVQNTKDQKKQKETTSKKNIDKPKTTKPKTTKPKTTKPKTTKPKTTKPKTTKPKTTKPKTTKPKKDN
ncbi:hypothetical protein [Spiroplasma endosymbiont of Amphibalanus improvisus]|uniref:hypothetical protein n=1 Tax=Spiroplasma endosymbiont of Amphibalanus improvisus TaxID=3066327 RepID=UPI00313BD358